MLTRRSAIHSAKEAPGLENDSSQSLWTAENRSAKQHWLLVWNEKRSLSCDLSFLLSHQNSSLAALYATSPDFSSLLS